MKLVSRKNKDIELIKQEKYPFESSEVDEPQIVVPGIIVSARGYREGPPTGWLIDESAKYSKPIDPQIILGDKQESRPLVTTEPERLAEHGLVSLYSE